MAANDYESVMARDNKIMKKAKFSVVFILASLILVSGFSLVAVAQKGEIDLLLNRHPFTESMIPLIPEFEEETGIEVGEVEILSESQYFQKLVLQLSNENPKYDVVMAGNPHIFQYAPAGWLEPLDKYIEDSPEWNIDDFYDTYINSVRWDLEPGHPTGTGSTWAIPVNTESHLLHMRYDLLQKYDLEIPSTWDEVYEAAKLVNEEEPNIVGFAHRGTKSWATIHPGYMAGFSSWGGQDFDKNLNVEINSEAGVRWTKYFMKLVKDAGSDGWPSTTWYDGKEQFAAENSFIWFDADHQAETFEEEDSAIKGKVAYVVPPSGPETGYTKTNLWTWNLAMNAASDNKSAAWEFIRWASSKDVLLATVPEKNILPPRKSVWNHPVTINYTEDWGVDETPYREVVNEMRKKAKVRWTPLPITPRVGDRWAQALQEIYAGKSVEKALDQAAKDISEMVKEYK